ncbi:lipocalin-like domain-containing protein [Halomonas sp. C05BenzN]|uniref:lipocalin-like domain-containing protein n=1 Tax=Halomonas sp. C05BenzN TaxID=3411041 RepID=UPI003B9274B6
MKAGRWLPGLLAALVLAGCEGEPPPGETAGFAGLGETAEGFVQASPERTLHFPKDHGPHPDTRIEWWYLTANLRDETGEPLGLQWTLFRQALTPPASRPAPGPWAADQLWMAHMAVSRGVTHRVAERFARSHSARDDGQAGARAAPFAAWLDDWRLESRVEAPHADTFERLTLTAQQDDEHGGFGYRLALTAEGPLVQHGETGFSQKAADGQGSMYYSQPFWRIEGEVTLDGETREVSGRGWLDREWSSQLLGPEQAGWDWFSLHLASGHKLMAFQLRGGGEDGGNYRSGTWITPAGEPRALAPDELALTPLATSRVAGRAVPTRWRLELPAQGLDLVVEAPHSERWMATSVAYWEGEVVVRDRDSDEALGEGYLEMTGY